MALRNPDITEHNNGDLAAMDADFLRGGGRRVADTAALYALSPKADQLKEFVSLVWVDSLGYTMRLVDTANIGNVNGWERAHGASFDGITGAPSDNAALSAVLGDKADLVAGKVPSGQLPSYVDDVVEAANFAALPGTGENGKIYITTDDNKVFRWSGSAYVEIVASPGSTDAVPEGESNKYFTAARVLATVLTGIGFGTVTAVLATDTILQAFGKLQAQLNGLASIFQAKENQSLSTGDNVSFANVEVTGTFKAGRANLGTGLPDGFYGNAVGRFLIGWNRSYSEGETVFANNGGTAPFAVGGYSFLHVDNSGVETEMLKLSGADFAAVFAGRVSPGIIDASPTPATKFLTYDPATKALISRTAAEVASDIGAGAVSGLEPKQILFGKGDGTLEQNAALEFDPATNSFYKSVVAKPFTSGNIYFFGDSITGGTGSTGGQRFAAILAARLGLTEVNNGVSASMLEKRSPIDPSGGVNMIDRISTIPTKGGSDRFIVFVYGINDVNYAGVNYTAANFETDYTTVINACLAKGWSPQEILITSTPYMNPTSYGTTGAGGGTITLLRHQQFNTAAQNVAAALGTKYFDIFTYISDRGGVFNLSDSVHPNNYGHYLMGIALANVLTRSVYYNNQSLAASGIVEFLDLFVKSNYVLPDSGTKILGIDGNGAVGVANSLPAGFKLNAPWLLGGFRQYGALTAGAVVADDIYLKTSAVLRAHFTSNDAWFGKIELLDTGARMVFRISYGGGSFVWYGGSDGTTEVFKVTNAGVVVVKQAEQAPDIAAGDMAFPQTRGIVASTGGVQGKFIPLEGPALCTVIKNDYSGGKVQVRVSGGSNGGVLNAWNFNADGSLEGLVNGGKLIMKSADGTRYSLTPPNGGGAATWVAV